MKVSTLKKNPKNPQTYINIGFSGIIKDMDERKYAGKTKRERFNSHTLRMSNGCLEWQLQLDRDGYGMCHIYPDGLRFDRAHRAAFYFAFGRVPNGVLRHTCDNRRCVEPTHLIEGTHADNQADKVSRNRQAKGETMGLSVLTESDVRRIRQMQSEGVKRKWIFEAIGKSHHAIKHVLYEKGWRHV